jgi:flagellar biosynthesis protein FlhB
MAEEDSGQEKTEEPTSRRLEKAREEGQIPRSKELNTTAVLGLGAAGLYVLGPFMSERITRMARYGFEFDRATVYDPNLMALHLLTSLRK